MEKLSMCRICLSKNAHRYGVVNENLHELYEKLTDIPFVTEDKRPILTCFLCFAKLKQCFRFMRKCLEAEELFARMNEGNPLINPEHLVFCSGFTRSPIELIDIVEIFQTESIVFKEEPAEYLCDPLDDIDETDGLFDDFNEEGVTVTENHEYLKEVKVPLEYSESDSEDDAPLKVFNIEVEEEIEESKKKRRAVENYRAPVTKKPKLDTRRTNLEGTITTVVGLKKNEQSNFKGIRTTKNCTSKHGHSVKESYKSDQYSSNRVKKFEQYTCTRFCEKLFNCDLCPRSYSRMTDFKKHFRIHTGDKPYQCDVCQRSFSHSFSLTKHIRTHAGKKPYQCDLCQLSFSKKCMLTRHYRTHTGEKPYQCDVCQRSFSMKWNLTAHARIHGEKPYQCDLCQRSFSHSFSLTKHIRLHAVKNLYQCDFCQRSFSKKCNITVHVRKHTGEKPYQCDVCQRSFSMKCNLTVHVRMHTGEKPYRCDLCRRSYRQRRDLINHIRVHTSEKFTVRR